MNIKKHVPWWPQLLAIVIGVGGIEGMRTGFGIVGDMVDRWRLPEVVNAMDTGAKSRDQEILSVVKRNSTDLQVFRSETTTNLAVIKKRQEKVIDFINSQTNHSPIEWPSAFKSTSLVRTRSEKTLANP